MARVEVGDRVELVYTSDPYTRLRPGVMGTVTGIDALGTIHVTWDSGSHLGLVPGEDEFRVVPRKRLVMTEQRWPVSDVGGDLEIHGVNYSDGSRRYAVVEFGGVLRSFEDQSEAQAYALGWRDRKDAELLGRRTHQARQ